MFLTIAIPIFNKESYIQQCVDSLLKQERINFEILLYNDGSTDNSLEICTRIQNSSPNVIRVESGVNEGSIIARRRCIDLSRGEYILIIDADDYFINFEATKIIEEYIKKTDSDLLIFNYTNNSNVKAFTFGNGGNQIVKDKEELYHIATKDSSFLNPLFNKVFSRKIVDREDYSRYKYIRNGTDYFQMLSLLTYAKRIVYLDKILYYYRKADNSIVNSFNTGIYDSLKGGYQRLLYVSQNWEITNKKQFEIELEKRCMYICTTAAYKVRMCSLREWKVATVFLDKIATDSFFKNAYASTNKKKLEINRYLILELLHYKKYLVLFLLARGLYLIKRN